MTTYKEMPSKLAKYEEFIGNSVKSAYSNKGIYQVYSYETLIYASNGYFDNSYYSVTTSKLQNMLIDIFNLNNGKKERD